MRPCSWSTGAFSLGLIPCIIYQGNRNFMEISLFQLVVICATIAVVLGFGIRAASSVHSTKGFSVGGRSAGVPLVAGGIAGTCVGGGATVGTAQLAATAGLSAWWFTIGSGVGLIIMGLFTRDRYAGRHWRPSRSFSRRISACPAACSRASFRPSASCSALSRAVCRLFTLFQRFLASRFFRRRFF